LTIFETYFLQDSCRRRPSCLVLGESVGTLYGRIWRRDSNMEVRQFSVCYSVCWVWGRVKYTVGSVKVCSWLQPYKSSYRTSVFLIKRNVKQHFENMGTLWMSRKRKKKSMMTLCSIFIHRTVCVPAERMFQVPNK
jgi:hypothetical protein